MLFQDVGICIEPRLCSTNIAFLHTQSFLLLHKQLFARGRTETKRHGNQRCIASRRWFSVSSDASRPEARANSDKREREGGRVRESERRAGRERGRQREREREGDTEGERGRGESERERERE